MAEVLLHRRRNPRRHHTFGETNEDTNQWQPTNPSTVKQAVTFGTNGFYLPFSNDALATSFTDASLPTVFTPTEAITADVMIIAGGGGGNMNDGGGAGGGGGGAGGLKYFSQTSLTAQDYTVVVGAGGDGGSNGNDSSFGAHIALKGGRGAPLNGYASGTFGSGGGAAAGSPGSIGQGTANQGNDGGPKGSGQGGGGGGSGAAGTTLTGGAGVTEGTTSVYDWEANDASTETLDINGTGNSYAGGGGGHPGGSGAAGGGNAQSGTSVGLPATANTGSGGGGSQYGYSAGAGGSGIVIIRYVGASAKATGGTITTYTDGVQYQVHTFLSTRSSHTITANGNVTNTRVSPVRVEGQQAAHIIGPQQGNSSVMYFAGDEDYLTIPDSADWNFGSSDFTIEMWVNMPNIVFQQENELATIISQADTISKYTALYWVTDNNVSNSKGFNFYAKTSGGGELFNFSTGVEGINNYDWNHVAVVRNGTSWVIYINGVSRASRTGSDTLVDWSYPLRIGTLWNSSAPAREWKGYLNEIRISNVARYTAAFTPPTEQFTSDANTKLLIHGSATTMGSTTFDDSSSSDHTITAEGAANNIVPKFGTGMGGFNTGASYLDFNNSNVMTQFQFPGSGSNANGGTITYETWVSFRYIPTTSTDGTYGPQTIFAQTASNVSAHYSRLSYNSGLKWMWKVYNSSDSLVLNMEVADSLTANTWYHVAFVVNGTNCKIYRDGVEKGSATLSGTPRTGTNPFEWGRWGRIITNPLTDSYFSGFMDESRISSTARYTSTPFTPSTTAFEDDKDTLLLLHMDGGGGIDPETLLPTLPGEGTYFWDASTDAIFYGADGIATNKSYITFDGNGDYLSAADSSDWNFGTGDFTLEMWINPTDVISNKWMGQYASGSSRWYWGIDQSTSRMIFYADSGGSVGHFTETTGSVTNGVWYHVAFVRSGSNAYMFTNGVGQGATQTTAFGTLPDVSSALNVGWVGDGTQYLDGDIDQARISNSARYTMPANQNTNSTASLVSGAIYSTNTVDRSNDGNDATQMQFTNAAQTCVVKYDFGSGNTITPTTIQFLWSQVEGVTSIKLEGSNNDSDYTQLFYNSDGNYPGGTATWTYGFSNTTAYRYFKYTHVQTTFDYPIYWELRLFEKAFTPPTEPFTADSNTKLLIQSDFSEGGLGADHSGNYNYFTPTNLAADDMMLDNPMNNFATINPLVKSYSGPNTITEGNLKIDQADDYNQWASTFAVKTGKWYCEFRCGDAGTAGFGIIADNATKWWDSQLSPQNGSGHILYTKDGVKNIDGTETSYGNSFTDGDIIGMAVNLTDSEVTYYKNGTVQNSGTAISFSGGITSANLIIPGAMTKNGTSYFNGGSDSSFSGTETSQGNQDGNSKGDFYYAPSSGYLALCTDNLPNTRDCIAG